MSPNFETFGRRVSQIGSIAELLAMETEEARSESFHQIDRIVGKILVKSLQGERIATIVQDHLNVNTVLIQGLSNEHRGFLTSTLR